MVAQRRLLSDQFSSWYSSVTNAIASHFHTTESTSEVKLSSIRHL
ncbi:hypothetical protein [Coleofasciculus sp. FACHB-SPT36]|nr:hypothetical protein [Coleofasciculus sp. FACHB-SPT36]